jgi:hypothetical protein
MTRSGRLLLAVLLSVGCRTSDKELQVR